MFNRRNGHGGGVLIRIRGRVPVEAHRGELPPDRPQVPDMDGSAVMRGHNQPRPIRAEERPAAAQVGAFQPRQRAARLRFHQTDQPVGTLDRHQPTVGRETAAAVADLVRLSPGADFPELAGRRRRHQPFAVGAEFDRGAAIDGKLGDLGKVGDAPDLGAVTRRVRAGRQPFPVGTDGDSSAIIQRADTFRPVRSRDVGIVMVALATIRPESSAAIPQCPAGSARGRDGPISRTAAGGVKCDRPATNTERAARDQIA